LKFLLFTLLVSFTAMAEDFLPASFSADYEESFKSAATGKEKKSTGKIDYKYPRHIRFEVASPDPSSFVANPKTSWYYTPPFVDGEEGQVVIQRSEDLVLTKFLDSLKNGAKTNAAYTVQFKKAQLVLTFSPALKKDLQMVQAILTAKSGEAAKATNLGAFQELELVHSNGRRVKMKFLEFRPGVTFDDKHFEFRVPRKTKVTQGK
jgi:outer membrane lipoprotein-sorting protein